MLSSYARILRFVVLVVALQAWAESSGDQPCLVERWTGLPGGTDGHFGYSVAMRDDMVLIGEFGKSKVYVHERIGFAWQLTDVLTGITGFGTAIGLSGHRAVFTSWGYDAATVCEWNGLKWAQSTVLVPEPVPPFFSSYGYAVAIDGDTIAVGAPNDNPKGAYSGSVFVYRFTGSEWIQEARLSASDGASGDELGHSVSVSGDRVFASAVFANAPYSSSGAVYVFDRDLTGSWRESAKIESPKPETFGNFGHVVLAAETELWVSSPVADTWTGGNTGAVYRFKQNEQGQWINIGLLAPKLASGGSPFFGTALARRGDVAVVGARGDAQNGPGSGAVFVFHRDQNGAWIQASKLIAPAYGPQDWFGSAVAVAGKFAAVGAHRDEPFGIDSGSAYLFAVGPDANNNGVMDPCECPGDLNKDWIVDQADLGLLLANWGCTGGLGYEPSTKPCPGALTGCCGDLDADGDVDQADLGVMLQNFGNVCP